MTTPRNERAMSHTEGHAKYHVIVWRSTGRDWLELRTVRLYAEVP